MYHRRKAKKGDKMRGKTRVQAPKYFGPKPLMVASDKTPVSAARSAGSTRLRGRDGELCSRHVESADICPLTLPRKSLSPTSARWLGLGLSLVYSRYELNWFGVRQCLSKKSEVSELHFQRGPQP